MFIIAEDFDVPPLNLPGLDEVEAAFTAFIDAEEEAILREILGDDFYEAFIDGIVDGDGEPILDENGDWDVDEIPERWYKIIVGDTYEINGKRFRWKGLAAALKPYIYSRWLSDDQDRVASGSVVVVENENAIQGDARPRICSTFNDFAYLMGTYKDEETTLYGYLKNSGATYDADVVAWYDSFELYLADKYGFQETINEFDF